MKNMIVTGEVIQKSEKRTISFTYYGEPVAKGRPKFFRRGSFIGTYTPAKTKIAENDFKAQAAKYRPKRLILGEVCVELNFYRSIPKSFSKRKRQDALDGRISPITKPDLDNNIKLVCDAMNKLFWQDDAQIVCMTVHKRYSDTPRIEVSLTYTEEQNG